MSNATANLPDSVRALIGTTLKGQYTVGKLLGCGAMGAVFEGKHTKLGKAVAIKVLFCQIQNGSDSAEFENRFLREAELASQINHQSVAQVFDFNIENGLPYMVMELVTGEDLSEIIERHAPMAPTQALKILRAITEALAAAAQLRVVHRDIKPGNIRVLGYGSVDAAKDEPVRLKVLDFGLAKRVELEEKNPLTKQGAFMGTPAYMAPEQISPEAVQMASGKPRTQGQPVPTIDERADLYSAGIILYELLTKKRPFQGDVFALVNQHLFQPPPLLPANLPGGTRALCMRLLEKQPSRRVQSAAELIQLIDRLLLHGGYEPVQRLRLFVPFAGVLLGIAASLTWRCAVEPVQHLPDLVSADAVQSEPHARPDLVVPVDLALPTDLTNAPDLAVQGRFLKPPGGAGSRPGGSRVLRTHPQAPVTDTGSQTVTIPGDITPEGVIITPVEIGKK